MSHIRAMIAEARGVAAPVPPWLRPAEPEVLAPPRHLSERRRVELSFPAVLAHRLVELMVPDRNDELRLRANAQVVFNAVALEPLDDLRDAERKAILDRASKLRVWLLDPYAEQSRSGLTMIYAFSLWLEDLRDRGILDIADDGAFCLCWDKLADGVLYEPENLVGLKAAKRSAMKMVKEWRRRLEARGYYKGE